MELTVENVALERGSLRGISLTLRGGELTALAGPSGIGKTSLLRAIVRLDEPAGGRVLLDGTDTRELDPRTLRRRVGFVAQAPAMLPGTVRENLAYALPTPPGEPALAAALGATGLAPAMLERDAAALSGGEQARVAVARALTRDPGALLLDEPTASLDPAATAAVERLLRDLAARGLALLVVTHDAAQAERIADRTVRLAGQTLPSAEHTLPPAEHMLLRAPDPTAQSTDPTAHTDQAGDHTAPSTDDPVRP